jgi:Lamin Tail Domain
MKSFGQIITTLLIFSMAFTSACDDDSADNNDNNINNINNANNTNSVCGNNIIEDGETCDGTSLGGLTCVTEGQSGGVISCNTDCSINIDNCTADCTNECNIGDSSCDLQILSDCVLDSETGCTVVEEINCADSTQVCDDTGGTALCIDGCTDICTENETQCSNTVIEICAVQEDGCTDWDTQSDCGDDSELCDDTSGSALCVPDCTPECTFDETRCSDTAIEICTDPDSNGCTIWSAQGTDCADTFMECDDTSGTAECITTCTPECTVTETRCSITAIQICNDPNSNGCTIWEDEGTDCADNTKLCEELSGTATCVDPPNGEECLKALELTIPIDLSGDSFSSDFPGDDFTLDSTTCDIANGPDAVIVVNLTAGATYIITEHDTLDSVIHVMDACDEVGTCIASADDVFNDTLIFAPQVSGDYYIILEAFNELESAWDRPYHLTVIEMESAETTCEDGMDNDYDGVIDCFDGDCFGIGPCGTEDSTSFCGDSIDNDGDGTVDCADTDCDGVDPCGTEDTTERCTDNLDNNNNGLTDCDDPDCFGVTGACTTEENCTDGGDNDSDGSVDCADTDCDGIGSCGPENSMAACDDSYDNDGDGLIDCNDPDCAIVIACMPKRAIFEQFTTSGMSNDNDMDGFRVVFTPDGTDYTYVVSYNAAYYITPGSSTTTSSVSAADSAIYHFDLPFSFSFYDIAYDELWVTSDGYISFETTSVTDSSESISDLFSSPKIAVAWDNLEEVAPGDLLYMDSGYDGNNGKYFWAFTYNMAEFNGSGFLQAQVVLFDDGVIQIDYIVNTLVDGITGISMVGLDPLPQEVSFVEILPQTVIFTEILANSAMLTEPEGEFFELYNTTNAAIDLSECEILDNGGTAYIVGDVTIPSHGYVTFENKTGSGTGGLFSPAVNQTVLALSNTADWLRLTCNGVDIDNVSYDSSLISSGISMQLNINNYDALDNDSLANWCLTDAIATYEFGDGTTTHYGSPNQTNHSCP